MSATKPLWMVVVGVAGVLALGGAMVIWPSYRQAFQIRARIAELERKAAFLDTETRAVERFTAQVNQLQEQIRTQFKTVPSKPEPVELMRKLSFEVDNKTVKNQSFSAGQPVDAGGGEDDKARAVPLTIELEANFETIFALLRSVESMDRLVRVTSMQVKGDKDVGSWTDPILTAKVELEAVYQDAAVEGP